MKEEWCWIVGKWVDVEKCKERNYYCPWKYSVGCLLGRRSKKTTK